MPNQSAPRAKRLFFDIETSPNIGLFWRAGYRINIPPENIIQERKIICIAWKWQHKKKVEALSWDKNQDDKAMLEKFIPILHEADEIVTHNGFKFDIPWVRTRCIYHSIPIVPKFIGTDTCTVANKLFNFNSNKMNYICQFLDIGKKTLTSYDLWKDTLIDNNRKTLKVLVDYCKNDVQILEELYLKMSPYIPPVANYGEFTNRCPSCNGETSVSKHRITAAGYHKTQYVCKVCGKYNTIATSRYKKGSKI